MEVIVYSLLPDYEGRFTMRVEPTLTVQKMIKAFCAENEIAFKSSYVLTSRSQEEFDKKRPLSMYSIQSGDEFYLTVRDDGRWACGCNQWWILVFICLAIGCLGIIAVSILQSINYDPVYSYGIGIDAGSSHTKLYVYQWPTAKSNGTGIVDEIFTCPSSKQERMPPLSDFVGNTSEAGKQCIKPCLDKALGVVPSREHSKTPVVLGATAGMRMLRVSDNASAEAIMSSVRETIAMFPFLVQNPRDQIRIIEGNEEGAFSWVTTNYLSGLFGFHPMGWIAYLLTTSVSVAHTIGALDLGGASTQITFQPESPSTIVHDYNATLILYGYTYNVYTYSYLCYGLNEAYRRHLAGLVRSQTNVGEDIEEPCLPKGFSITVQYKEIFSVPCTLAADEPKPGNVNVTFNGTSDTRRCQELTQKLFNKTTPCSRPPCTFDGVYQPPLYDDFLAFSGFYYTVKFLNLTSIPNFTLSDFEEARDSYCNKSHSQILKMRQNPYLLSYCFNSHFIYGLLVDGYGFNDSNWHSIDFDNKVNGAELGWILGMMINTTNVIPPSPKVQMIALPVFIILLVIFFIFLLLSVAFAIHARRWNRRDYRSLPSMEERI